MNKEFGLLVFFRDPFAIEPPQFILSGPDNKVSEITFSEIGDIPFPLVTYEAWALVDELRRLKGKLPATLIDVSDALRLNSGMSRDQGAERKWDHWNALKPYFRKVEHWSLLKNIFLGQSERPAQDQQLVILNQAVEAFKRLWTDLVEELKVTDEYERFFSIEVPASQIFLNRQLHGIRVDLSGLNELRRQAENEKYQAYQEVARQIGIGPTGMRYHSIGPFLSKTDASHLESVSDQSNFEEHMKIASFNSKFAQAFTTFTRASRDLLSLSRMSDPLGRVFPFFSTMGTVTGRILVSDPHIQQLRRKYRKVIQADEGHELVYLDYSQFEPGILAAKSNDAALISEYNSSDLYSSLAISLFNDQSKRQLCKRIFLAHCYGMEHESIVRLLAGPNAKREEAQTLRMQVEVFFGRYQRAAKYRDELQHELSIKGEIRTEIGNRRLRTSAGKITSKESRWAVSQSIQGTASLIFKEALIELANQFTLNAILIPMHDGVLLQLRNDINSANTAKEIMERAFKRRFPLISPRVVQGPFADV